MAALVHAAAPLTAAALAAALGWPGDRVAQALHDAARRPDLTDPIVLHHPTATTCTFRPRPERLTTAQRRALERPAGHHAAVTPPRWRAHRGR
ncbi:hypothetical protein [Spirillospora sp. NPDC047279]|uniref:hypothetical protein n=1 Tax=Spirillospora sp. NPDC047279 TaxID=3155478 RepID=UPI0033C90109